MTIWTRLLKSRIRHWARRIDFQGSGDPDGNGGLPDRQIQGGLETLGITIGKKFLDSSKDAIKGGNAIMEAFSGIVKEGTFDPVFEALSGFGQRLGEYMAVIAKNLPAAFEKVDFDGLLEALGDLGDAFGTWFDGIDLTTVDGLAEALQGVVDMITGLVNITAGMVEQMDPFLEAVGEFLQGMADGDEETQKTVGKILLLAKAVEAAGIAFVAAVIAIDEYKLSIAGAFKVIAGGAQMVWNVVALMADAIQGAFVVVEGLLIAFVEKITLGLANLSPKFRDFKAIVTDSGKQVSKSIDTDAADFTRGMDKMIAGFNDLASNSKTSATSIKASMDKVPTEKKIDLDISSWTENANQAPKELFAIPSKKTTKHVLESDPVQYETVTKLISETLPDGTVTIHEVLVNETKLEAAKKTIDAALPKEKKIDASIETAKIKAEADIITKAIEWKAKVDISQAEQATKQLETMFKSIDTGIDSTGDTLASLFKTMEESGSNWQLYDAIEKEKTYREQEFDLQKQLIEKQLQLQQAKIEAMKSGSQIIQIQGSNLQPHLEAILWEILTAIQVRANEEAAEFLLGFGGAAA